MKVERDSLVEALRVKDNAYKQNLTNLETVVEEK